GRCAPARVRACRAGATAPGGRDGVTNLTRVVLLDDWERTSERSESIRRLRSDPRVHLTAHHDHVEGAQLRERLEGAAVVIAIRERTAFTAEVLAMAPGLRLIAQTGTGTAHVDMVAAEARGVVVSTTPGASTSAVVELSLG